MGIMIPALARPTLAELNKWGVKGIAGDMSPTKEVSLGLATFSRGSGFMWRWSCIQRYVNLNLLLGYQHAMWLLGNTGQPEVNALFRPWRRISFVGLGGTVGGEDQIYPYIYVSGGGERTLGWEFAITIPEAGEIAVSLPAPEFIARHELKMDMEEAR